MGNLVIFMRGRRGWIRILEATIAVMIVSAAMIAVYSEQSVREDLSVATYSSNVQTKILDDVVSDIDLRLNVLRVVDDVPGDYNYDQLDAFVQGQVPGGFGYLLRVCELGDDTDFCKMDAHTFSLTLGKDVFVEEEVISSELGDGSIPIYSPKKVKLFFWEGELPSTYCRDECFPAGTSLGCSLDLTQVLTRDCGNFDSDNCLEYGAPYSPVTCNPGQLCVNDTCLDVPSSSMICERNEVVYTDCVSVYRDDCIGLGYDGGQVTGNCSTSSQSYECWNTVRNTTSCSANPVCPAGYNLASRVPCGVVVVGPTVANLVVGYGNIRQNVLPDPGCNPGDTVWFHYDMSISETTGLFSVTLGSRQRCFYGSDGGVSCAGVNPNMAVFSSNVVSPGGTVTATNRWFCLTPGFTYDVVETLYSDTSGANPVLSYNMTFTV